MPTYEYACTACAERLEVVQSYTDDALTECPSCRGRLRKVFSPVGIVFKGSGFYKNDSRKTGSSSGSGSGSDSKPESRTESTAKSGSTSTDATSSSSSGDSGSSTGTTTPAAAPAKTASSAPAAG